MPPIQDDGGGRKGVRERKGRDGDREEERGFEREGGTGDDGGGRKGVRERIQGRQGGRGIGGVITTHQ